MQEYKIPVLHTGLTKNNPSLIDKIRVPYSSIKILFQFESHLRSFSRFLQNFRNCRAL